MEAKLASLQLPPTDLGLPLKVTQNKCALNTEQVTTVQRWLMNTVAFRKREPKMTPEL